MIGVYCNIKFPSGVEQGDFVEISPVVGQPLKPFIERELKEFWGSDVQLIDWMVAEDGDPIPEEDPLYDPAAFAEFAEF